MLREIPPVGKNLLGRMSKYPKLVLRALVPVRAVRMWPTAAAVGMGQLLMVQARVSWRQNRLHWSNIAVAPAGDSISYSAASSQEADQRAVKQIEEVEEAH
jgi:hypothetical protein